MSQRLRVYVDRKAIYVLFNACVKRLFRYICQVALGGL
jgi:hypothetical protein